MGKIKLKSYDNNVIINGKIYPYNARLHYKEYEEGKIYTFSKAIEELRKRKGR